jgi:putative transcription factor
VNCELCGSGIRGEPQAVNIDGGIFRVCNSCARLGTPARIPGRSPSVASRPSYGSARPRGDPLGVRRTTSPPPPAKSFDEESVELTGDYPKIIKSARELLGLSQEELGMKINEKPSVISHLETGSMKPDDALARKLEHYLRVQLFVPTEELDGES